MIMDSMCMSKGALSGHSYAFTQPVKRLERWQSQRSDFAEAMRRYDVSDQSKSRLLTCWLISMLAFV